VAKVIAHAKKFSKSYYKDEYDKYKKKTGNKIINEKSPWYTDFESMAKKTLIMAIWKYLPVSTELMLAATTDETIKSDLGDVRDERDIITIASRHSENDEVEMFEIEESHLRETKDSKQEQPEPSGFPLPEAEPVPTGPATVTNGAFTEVEKLREKAKEMLLVHMGLTEIEADEWCLKNFGRKRSELSKRELETTITRGNAELDARDGVNSPNQF
jgi:hypothetical protein